MKMMVRYMYFVPLSSSVLAAAFSASPNLKHVRFQAREGELAFLA
jgi:hypothetical protein